MARIYPKAFFSSDSGGLSPQADPEQKDFKGGFRISSRRRILSGSLIIGLTAVSILNPWPFLVLVCSLTFCGLYEFFAMMKRKGIPTYYYSGVFIGVLVPLAIFFDSWLAKDWGLLFVVVAMLFILLLQFARKDNSNAIVGISTTIFGVIYVSWFFSFLVRIRGLLPGAAGIKLIAFILLVTKSGDMGAFLIGRWIGKHPLLPRVSPNKSIEGAIGNLLFSLIAAVLFQSFLPRELNYSWVSVAWVGVFFGAIGQLGDLSESLIKRDCQVKDSGNILPGIGGVLDAIDSLLFCAPVFYLYMSWIL